MLSDAEAKGAAQASEEYADELEEIKAEAEVKIVKDTHQVSFTLVYNVSLDVFDLLADDPRRAPPAVPSLILSVYLPEAAERLAKAEREAQAAARRTSTSVTNAQDSLTEDPQDPPAT